MFAIHGPDGRLIVAMSMRVRHSGKLAYVFVDGRKVAAFTTMGEAANYACSIAQRACVEVPGAAPTFDEE